ncbi:MAG: choice-of-anchor R domain-containing protein [Patescibacteria group bacterium]
MQNLKNKKIKRNSGAAMLISIVFFLFISLAIISGLVSPSIREFKNASVNLNSKKSFFLAESGGEDAFYRILKNKPIEGSEIITLDSNSATTTITTLGSGEKQIVSLGDVSDYQRQLGITLSTSTGVSFNYGVQVGQGGINLTGSGTVNGNVYANGPITGDSSAIISGTAISANSPALAADQTNGTGTPAYNISFANASGTQDIAQSFQVAIESPLNKIQLYIKKTGAPSDATVKIVNDTNGNPGTTIFATGTLSASTVTTSYGWINVTFSSNPLLDVGTTYWLVVDAGTSSTKYYTIGASNGGYANGVGKIGQVGGTWNNTTPSGLDYYFSIYLGGVTGLIAGSSGSQWNQLHIGTVSGTAQAHTVNYTNATGNIYCQSGTGNNKSCTSQTDPTYIAFPISDANIAQWQADALAGGTYNGDYSVGGDGATLGPKKIIGNLTVSGGGILTVTGTLWVTGNIVLNGGGEIKLASSYGSNDGVLVADGTITISGGGHATGSGTTSSYIMMLSTNSGSSAITVSGGAGAVIVYASFGTINISGGASLKEVTAYKILVSGGSSITYESGLTNNNFSSGPSGSWAINSWGEK